MTYTFIYADGHTQVVPGGQLLTVGDDVFFVYSGPTEDPATRIAAVSAAGLTDIKES